jgi:hypothetical protein
MWCPWCPLVTQMAWASPHTTHPPPRGADRAWPQPADGVGLRISNTRPGGAAAFADFDPFIDPPRPGSPVFKPNLAQGVETSTPFRPPPTGRDPCVQARSAPGRAIPFWGRTSVVLASFQNTNPPPRGADRHLTTIPPPRPPSSRSTGMPSGNRPGSCTYLVPPKPRNRCVQAASPGGGAKVGAPLRPPKWPQSLCSSQIRPWGANSLLGATSGVLRSSHTRSRTEFGGARLADRSKTR